LWQPAALRDAVRVAVDLGLAESPNEVAVAAVRRRIEAFAQSLALAEHFAAHPAARPSLGDLAIAAAELDGHPLAGEHEFLRRCADEVAAIRPDPKGEDGRRRVCRPSRGGGTQARRHRHLRQR
jgi:hypothetical protein